MFVYKHKETIEYVKKNTLKAYFLRKIQTFRAKNWRIVKIQDAKFSGYYFYMNTKIWRDFRICISAPLVLKQSNESSVTTNTS